MVNINVAMIGPPGYGRDVGKKGTETDMTYYNLKRGEDSITLIEPSRYPDRLAPLFYSASVAHFAIIVLDRIDHLFGEVIVMLDCCGVERGLIVLRNFIVREQVEPLIAGTAAQGYEFFEDDPLEIRGRLMQELDAMGPRLPHEPFVGSVPVDHFFNVKGVGTVILGSVVEGVIRKHDKLRVLPGEKTATVRSIQKHDEDCDWAVEGERVGVALKNINAEELDRGFVLTSNQSMRKSSTLDADAFMVKYWNSPLKEGMVLHIGHWMQFLPCRVERVDVSGDWRKPRLSLRLEKELVHPPGSRAVLMQLDGGKLRVVGRLNLP